MAVYVLCRNAQLNLTILIMTCMCIVMLSLFVNCPTVICSPNMLLSYGRDTSSELWTPVLFFTSHTIYCNTCFTVFFAYKHLPLDTFNPLLQQAGEIDNLTVSLGQSTLVLLCRFHVGAGIPGVAPHHISRPSTFNVLLGSSWFDQPWFLSEGKLATVRIIPSSWGSQRTCELHAIKLFFWRRCRGDQDTLQGEPPLLNLFTLLLSCFILFTTLFAALNQNTKKISC